MLKNRIKNFSYPVNIKYIFKKVSMYLSVAVTGNRTFTWLISSSLTHSLGTALQGLTDLPERVSDKKNSCKSCQGIALLVVRLWQRTNEMHAKNPVLQVGFNKKISFTVLMNLHCLLWKPVFCRGTKSETRMLLRCGWFIFTIACWTIYLFCMC